MRFGPLSIVRAASAPALAKPSRELGASGTINMQGSLSPDEYNRDIVWPLSLTVYNRMRRSDPAVRESSWHIFAPLLRASWEIDPASDEPEDLEIAEFARRALFEWPKAPWGQTLRTALLYLVQGYQWFELVEETRESDLEYEDSTLGETVVVPSRQFVTWRKIAHRRPETVYKWIVEGGELLAIQQQVLRPDGQPEQPVIPADQILLFVNEQEGDDFTGVSILRTSYKSWRMKETTEIVALRSLERHGVGINVAYVPEDVRRDDAQMDVIEKMVRDLGGDWPYLVFPGPKGSVSTTSGGGNGGYFFEIATPSAGLPDFTPLLEYLRGEIKGNMLVRFSELGHGSTGARATGDVQSQVWYDALGATGEYMAAVFTDALERLIAKNYQTDRFPKVIVRDIESRNLAEFADAAAKLVSSQAVEPDTSFRASVRTTMGWPDEDDPVGVEDRRTMPPPDPFAGSPIEPDPTLNGPAPPPKPKVPA